MTGGIRAQTTRGLVTAALTLALVAGSATTAFALWSAKATAASSVTAGKLTASLTGTNGMTTTFSPTLTSLTAPLTFTNSSNIPGQYSTSVTASSGTALANAVRVVAWPVALKTDCTAAATVGPSSVTGTWASLPSVTGSLAAGASSSWCTRSTPTSQAPVSSTTNIQVALVVSNGSWASSPDAGIFYLNTSAATTAAPALQCTNPDPGNFHATISFDTSSRPAETYYGLQIAGTRVNPPAQGYTGNIDLAGTDVPSALASDGVVRVDVAVLDSNESPTGEIAASGDVTVATTNGSRTVNCGG